MCEQDSNLDQRVKRLEEIVEMAIKVAESHPMGKMFLGMLGIK